MRNNFFFIIPFVATIHAGSAFAESPNPGHALAQRFAVDEKAPAKATSTKQGVGQSRTDYEQEIQAAARAEAEALRRTEANKSANSVLSNPAMPQSGQSQQAPAVLAQSPAQPAKRVAAPQHMQIKIEAKIPAPAPALPAPQESAAPRASVLVVLSDHAGQADKITSSDPVLCVSEKCYVSAGHDKNAHLLVKSDVLSTSNTITNGAGACKGRKFCTFRGVAVTAGSQFEIIDLGIVKHHRREAVDAQIDGTCQIEADHLSCANPITAANLRMWIVPESIAASAGPAKIEEALLEELPEENIERAGDK